MFDTRFDQDIDGDVDALDLFRFHTGQIQVAAAFVAGFNIDDLWENDKDEEE